MSMQLNLQLYHTTASSRSMKGRVSVNNFGTCVDYFCRKSDTRTLKKLAFAIGSKEGSTKSAIRSNIVTQCAILEQLASLRNINGSLTITAIDMGIDNFAHCRLDWSATAPRPQLLEWGKLQLSGKSIGLDDDKIPFTPENMSRLGYKLTEQLTRNTSDAFVLERQRTRTMGSSNVFEPVLRVNTLEHVLFSNLFGRLQPKHGKRAGSPSEYLVCSSDPKRMTEYWCKHMPSRSKAVTKAEINLVPATKKPLPAQVTKKLKIALAHSLVSDAATSQSLHKLSLPSNLVSSFRSQTLNKKISLFDGLGLSEDAGKNKEDDLADSLLHALAWFDWVNTFDELTKVIRSNGTEGPVALAAFNAFVKQKNADILSFSKTCIPNQ
ncbi:LAFE_0C13344g1_1 [Lachancea fermentati]|uniref:LAFE_0C13344g1_1 n=1 Tax=Lachancea fermentati TaxID=4955 RepID=A0A1G4MAX3_LACFM|nr:LAFE_0C13344g1_1 [Lachancea fermentati]